MTLPPFEPTGEWYTSQPWGEDSLVSLAGRITVAGEDIAGKDVVARCTRTMHPTESECVFYRGGYDVEFTEIGEKHVELLITSAGQDGIESAIMATGDLIEELQTLPAGSVAVEWTERPATRIDDAAPHDS